MRHSDFDSWAESITDREDLARELKNAYMQGREDEKQFGWVEDLEADTDYQDGRYVGFGSAKNHKA